MNTKNLPHITFFTVACTSLLVALFVDKIYLLFMQPLSVVLIFWIYMVEKKESINYLYIAALTFSFFGSILLLIDFKKFVTEVSILFSLFYMMYLCLMYSKNEKKRVTTKMYVTLLIIFIPIVYVYDSVICLIHKEIKKGFAFFSVLVLFMLIYLFSSLYYYLRNKNQSNLWMLIAAANIGIMNIFIMINELYIYDTMFTIIALFCSYFMYYFSLKFVLEDDSKSISNPV